MEEQAAVQRVLASGHVSYWTGEEGRRFEAEYAEAVGVPYAVAVANGTVALELALVAAGVGPGDEVVVPARTFIATASAVVRVGARPVFADVDLVSQTVTAATVERCLTPQTKAVIAVHLAGWPCEMDPLMALAEARGLVVIEDAAQAHGAMYHGRPVGSLGHLAAFSFCQDKILTTGGEGGLVTMQRRDFWERVWSLKEHGKGYDAVFHTSGDGPGYRSVYERVGTNGRMTEMQAAIGRVILQKLPAWRAARRRHAAALDAGFAALPALRLTPPPPHVGHAYYKHYAFVRPEQLRPGWSRDRILAAVQAEGIPCFSGSCPEVYLEAPFQQAGLAPRRRLPNARALGETSLMFLVHPTLTEHEIADTCAAVAHVLAQATG